MTEAELLSQGFTHEHCPESWQEVGDAESGPKLIGGPACDVYTKEALFYVFENGILVDVGTNPYWNMDVSDQF